MATKVTQQRVKKGVIEIFKPFGFPLDKSQMKVRMSSTAYLNTQRLRLPTS